MDLKINELRREKHCILTCADSKGLDQPAHFLGSSKRPHPGLAIRVSQDIHRVDYNVPDQADLVLVG